MNYNRIRILKIAIARENVDFCFATYCVKYHTRVSTGRLATLGGGLPYGRKTFPLYNMVQIVDANYLDCKISASCTFFLLAASSSTNIGLSFNKSAAVGENFGAVFVTSFSKIPSGAVGGMTADEGC